MGIMEHGDVGRGELFEFVFVPWARLSRLERFLSCFKGRRNASVNSPDVFTHQGSGGVCVQGATFFPALSLVPLLDEDNLRAKRLHTFGSPTAHPRAATRNVESADGDDVWPQTRVGVFPHVALPVSRNKTSSVHLSPAMPRSRTDGIRQPHRRAQRALPVVILYWWLSLASTHVRIAWHGDTAGRNSRSRFLR
jgi:hypothetical protein